MKVITLQKVITLNRGSDWKAFLLDKPSTWTPGRTEAEAIGNLQLRLSSESTYLKDLVTKFEDVDE